LAAAVYDRCVVTLDRSEALALLAVACDARGSLDEALEALERAATLARPGGIVCPFAEAGGPVKTAIRLNSVEEY